MSYPIASQLYQAAAAQGSKEGHMMLGTISEKGLGRPVDLSLAIHHYKIAAEKVLITM